MSDALVWWTSGHALLGAFLIAVALSLTALAAISLWWNLYAWQSTNTLRRTAFTPLEHSAAHSFTLLVPARHEQAVIGATLDRLALQAHPRYDIVAIVGDDDPGTEAAIRQAAGRHPNLISVVVDSGPVKSKPQALNVGLTVARGDIVGVFDAEDDAQPGLLTTVDAQFTETGADAVQGGVQLMDYASSWWAVRNVMEYYFAFRSRMHLHAASRFVPLGGTTVFIRREELERMGGWDADSLTEDCDLGVRLAKVGATVSVAYDAATATREETPGSVAAFIRQRTRWNQGFLQVLAKGEWRELPSLSQRILAWCTLVTPVFQAVLAVLIPASLTAMVFVRVPPLIAFATLVPLAVMVVMVVADICGLHDFARAFGIRLRLRDHVKLIVGTVPYQALLAYAALRALVRHRRGITGWEKTSHAGAHRAGPAFVATEPSAAPAAPPAQLVKPVQATPLDASRSWLSLTAPAVVAVAAALVAAQFVLPSVLVWALCRRLGLRHVTALGSAAALLLMAASGWEWPSTSAMVAVTFVLSALLLATSPSRQLLSFAGAAAACVSAISIDSTLLAVVPLIAWAAVANAEPLTRRFAVPVAGAVFGMGLTLYVVFAVWVGGLEATATIPAQLPEWFPAAVATAAVLSLLVKRLRALAVGALAFVVCGALFGGLLGGTYSAVLVPVAAILIGGVGDVSWGLINRPATTYVRKLIAARATENGANA